MCKFCTHQAFFKFSLLEYIIDMTSDDCSVFLKQLRHLRLRQPNGFILKLNIYTGLTICRLVYNDAICLAQIIHSI